MRQSSNSQQLRASSMSNGNPLTSMRSKIPTQKFLYPSVSHTSIKAAIDIEEYLNAVISYCIRALKIPSLVFCIMLVKSWRGLAKNRRSFKYSEQEGTMVLHWRNSRIAFSHLVISLGEKAQQVSCIRASKEKQSTSQRSSTYTTMVILLYSNLL